MSIYFEKKIRELVEGLSDFSIKGPNPFSIQSKKTFLNFFLHSTFGVISKNTLNLLPNKTNARHG